MGGSRLLVGQAQQRLDPLGRCWILHSDWPSSRRGQHIEPRIPAEYVSLSPAAR